MDRDETGTGVIGTMFGALVFLSFVAMATHTILGLYATSVVKSVTWDAARQAATGSTSLAAADAALHEDLAGFTVLSTQWSTKDPSVVRLSVKVERPSVLPRSIASRTSLTTIEQEVTVRSEGTR